MTNLCGKIARCACCRLVIWIPSQPSFPCYWSTHHDDYSHDSSFGGGANPLIGASRAPRGRDNRAERVERTTGQQHYPYCSASSAGRGRLTNSTPCPRRTQVPVGPPFTPASYLYDPLSDRLPQASGRVWRHTWRHRRGAVRWDYRSHDRG